MNNFLGEKFISEHRLSLAASFIISSFCLPYIHGLNFYQKLAALVAILVISTALLLIKDAFKKKKASTFHRKREAVGDLKLLSKIYLTPVAFVHFILSFSAGGLIGFLYLTPTLFSFCASGLVMFFIVMGLEMIILDIFCEEHLVTRSLNAIKSFSGKVFSSTFYLASLITVVCGVIISATYYSSKFTDLILVVLVAWCMAASTILVFHDIDDFK